MQLKKEDIAAKAPTRAERLREASQERREQERQDVRQRILQASSELFLQHGYAHFSLRQVAETIGYSPGTIYLYFKDKDEMLFTLMNDGAAEFHRMMQAAAATAEPRARLAAIGQAYVDFGRRYPAYYQLMFMQRTDYLLRADMPPQTLLGIFDLWRVAVEDAMRAGVLHMGDPVSVGDSLWALLHGVVSIAILMPNFDETRIRKMVEAALGLMTNGLHVR